MRFRIYNKLLIFIFKNLSLLINYTFKFLYKNIIILSSIFKIKKDVSQKITSNKKTFAKKKMPHLGSREEKEKQKELELGFQENTIFTLPHLELLTEPKRKKEYKNNEEQLENTARMLENVLDDFGIRGEIGRIQSGPVVTRYEL